jgi:pyruvate dehydrogenase E2 component (dihydrolipoamide acetyltransferase)
MAKEVIMPALGMAQETGTLLAWHKQAGETVAKGEPLMTVATDKTDVEIEANASGVLANVTANVGDEVPVGQVIALILAPGEVAPFIASSATPSAPAVAPTPVGPAASQVSTAPGVTPVAARLAAERGVDLGQVKAGVGGKIQKEDVLAYLAEHKMQPGGPLGAVQDGRILASPKARRLARENGLSLAEISGSGPDGAVLAGDVLGAQQKLEKQVVQPIAPAAAVVQPAPTVLPVSRAWRIMAQRLQQSWTTAPHFYLERTVNAGPLVHWRQRAQARNSAKITVTDLVVKVVAAALRKHPRLNASWLNDEIIANDQINLGLAVAVEDGLLVPVVHGADQLGLGEIAARRAALVERAQTGKLTPDDLSGGTFTLSNLGMYGVEKFNAIVNPPQAAILAVGSIVDAVVPVNGQPAIQPMMTLTLSCDHRVVDGARGAQFLQTLVAFIEDPLTLLD